MDETRADQAQDRRIVAEGAQLADLRRRVDGIEASYQTLIASFRSLLEDHEKIKTFLFEHGYERARTEGYQPTGGAGETPTPPSGGSSVRRP
jgi:hypothetical protein